MQIKLANNRIIGDQHKPYIIAEIGINHNGNFEMAVEMIHEAAKTGVDAVKFQKRTVTEMYTKTFLDQPYLKSYAFGPTYGAHKLFLEFSDEQFFELKKQATIACVDFIVSGFDATSFEFIDKQLNVDIHKIASPFVTHYPLLKQVAAYGKPLILSTGMHTNEEIKAAVAYLKQFTSDIILFQATTMYPCPDELVNLNVLKTYRAYLNVLVGYSSHDNGFIMPAASVAAGACTIEKHFTLDKKMIGPDHSASADPTEMAMIVQYAKQVFKGMGDGLKILNEEEKEARLKYGVSIVSAATIQKGDFLTEELLTVKCPGGGISPVLFDSLIGKRATRVIEKDETINIQDVE